MQKPCMGSELRRLETPKGRGVGIPKERQVINRKYRANNELQVLRIFVRLESKL